MPRVFQPVPNVIEVTVQGTMDGQLIENKYYAKSGAAVTAAMVTSIANTVDNWVAASFLPVLSSAYTYVRTIARDLTSEASFEAVDSSHGNTPGSISGDFLPNNVSLAIHRDTGLSGKKAKSRVYWPVITDAQRSGANNISSGAGSAFIAALDALRTAILTDSSSTYTYGYVQRILNHVKLTNGNFIEVFAHTLTDLVLDSMRDRLPGHGL